MRRNYYDRSIFGRNNRNSELLRNFDELHPYVHKHTLYELCIFRDCISYNNNFTI